MINDHEGDATDTEWLLSFDGPVFREGQEGDTDINGTQDVPAGFYDLAESGPDGYTQKSLSCTGADLAGSTLTLGDGDDAICTFTNDDIPPPPKEVPVDNTWALLLLILAMFGMAWYWRPAGIRR